ncbi:UvrD-helicase domain-containing protein, partial [Xanthomonas sp. SHU 199]|uniref:UvrD-helicase domain-containing protein n=1 Tax=Xanthomonas sp. SHU 199 TaxID=1591174 RepID=UPI00035C9A60
MNAAPDRDPYLQLPLHGVRLIEASAGTGKTFTLATLFTRLVVERGLRLGQILAVTFTEAATQELRRRIRERLALAATLVPDADGSLIGAALVPFSGSAATDLSQSPPHQDLPDVALTRAILTAHLAASTETPAALRRRLQQAAEDIDLAAIFTIHGFCARVLREHALESGQAFAAPQLLTDDRELLRDVAADLWRQRAADPAMAEDLVALWPGGPDGMATDLRELVRHPTLLPAAPVFSDEDGAVLQQAAQRAGMALAEAFRTHGTACFEAIAAAMDAGVLSKVSYKPDWLTALWHWLDAFAAAPTADAPPHPKLIKLTAAELTAGTNKKHAERTPASPLGHAIDGYLAALAQLAQWRTRRRIRLLHALRADAVERLAYLKRQRRVQTYDDLVEGVARALEGPHGAALAQRLRAQYAVALVDEFQDTDDRQWTIFRKVFAPDTANPAAVQDDAAIAPSLSAPDDTRPLLALIGDPKQAIYGFRGGDVRTYLAAAADAERAPPLAHNFRSRPALLAAIDALYTQAGYADAFLTDGIAFHPVQPGSKRVDADLQRNGAPAPALTVWRAPEPPPPPA